jgi:hypothetical protein
MVLLLYQPVPMLKLWVQRHDIIYVEDGLIIATLL